MERLKLAPFPPPMFAIPSGNARRMKTITIREFPALRENS